MAFPRLCESPEFDSRLGYLHSFLVFASGSHWLIGGLDEWGFCGLRGPIVTSLWPNLPEVNVGVGKQAMLLAVLDEAERVLSFATMLTSLFTSRVYCRNCLPNEECPLSRMRRLVQVG
jgi:hypothetical protein